MKKTRVIPILVFIITLILGVTLIFTSEKVSQKKAGLITKQTKAQEGVCGGAPGECPQTQTTAAQECPGGVQGTCTDITTYLLDTSGCPQCYPCESSRSCVCPQVCNGSCTSNNDCLSGYTCYDSKCRNLNCPDESDCTCKTPTLTPTPTGIPPTPTLTPTPTNTPTPTPTPTSGPTPTPVPVGCGTKGCDNAFNPCRPGLTCVQGKDGANYCSLPEFATACRENPSTTTCCSPTNPTNTPAPTQIILANNTPAPTKVVVTSIPSVGSFSKPMLLIPLGILLLGLFL